MWAPETSANAKTIVITTRPNASAIPTSPRPPPSESTTIAPHPKNTRAKVPSASAPRRRARSPLTPSGCRYCAIGEKPAYAIEHPRPQAIERVRPALLAFEQAGVDQLFEVVTHRRLLDAQERLEIADAHRPAIGLDQTVEDLEPVPVRECLEQPLELRCVARRERRARDRRTALDEWKLPHPRHGIDDRRWAVLCPGNHEAARGPLRGDRPCRREALVAVGRLHREDEVRLRALQLVRRE